MAETYGFFDSSSGDTRTYSADDFNNVMSALFADGVMGSDNPLNASSSGLTVAIAPGMALIDGHWYKNSTDNALTITPPGSGVRYDRIVLRLNRNTKTITLAAKQGTASAPPALFDSSSHKEISICKILVATSQIIATTDERQYAALRRNS